MAIEVRRMQRVILEQKGLRRDVLEKQREPVMKLQQEAQAKKRKIREILNLQDKIFEESVALLFPQLPEEPKEVILPPLRPSKERRWTMDEFIKMEIDLRKEVRDGLVARRSFQISFIPFHECFDSETLLRRVILRGHAMRNVTLRVTMLDM
jgi:hypothetical protein